MRAAAAAGVGCGGSASGVAHQHHKLPLLPRLAAPFSSSSSSKSILPPAAAASAARRNGSVSSRRRGGGAALVRPAAASAAAGAGASPLPHDAASPPPPPPAAAAASPAPAPDAPLDLETVLARVRAAVQGSSPLWQAAGNTNGQVYGEGVHMGLPVAWAFMWRPDGAWYEEVRSQHLTYKWGCDGAGNSWEVDPYGVSKVLERDDNESSVLGALIRSGNWLVPAVSSQLVMQLDAAPAGSSGAPHCLPMPSMPPVAATWEAHSSCAHTAAAASATAATGSSSSSGSGSGSGSGSCWGVGSGPVAAAAAAPALEQSYTPDSSSSVSSSDGAAADGISSSSSSSRRRSKDISGASVYVTLRLKDGRVLARVQVATATWRPVSYRLPFCSDSEAWLFEEWHNWSNTQQQQQGQQQQLADVFYPRQVKHVLCKGVANTYFTLGGITRGCEVHTAYRLPVSPPVPIDVQYLETVSPQVPAWQTHQGHLLVEAHLNGRKAGWMLLDTGASGFVIEPKVADEYRLPAFGQLSIAGIAGKVPTRFRRASQLRLGPLVLSDPVMLEMSISRIVGTFHDKVIGIVGYDVFRRCRLTIPCHNTRKTIQRATSRNGRVSPHNADHATPAAARFAAHPWPPTAAEQQQLAAVTQLQQGLAAVTAAAGSSSSHGGATGALAAMAAAVGSRRRSSSRGVTGAAAGKRRRSHSASVSSSSSSPAAAAATAAATTTAAPLQDTQQQQQQDTLSSSLCAPHLQQQQQGGLVTPSAGSSPQEQQQPSPPSPQLLLQLPPVVVPPPRYSSTDEPLPTALIEVLLHRPVMRAAHEFEDGYIWQDIVMIASLPHVELEFVVPGKPNSRHSSLFLVDSGAGGAEVMFHSRAARELGLLDHQEEQYKGWGEGLATFRTVSGVGGNNGSSSSSSSAPSQPPAAPQPSAAVPAPVPATTSSSSSSSSSTPPQGNPLGVGCQAGLLPELVIRGQAGSDPSTQGSLQLRGVRALFNRAGGLDISLYSAGMVCADLLSRMQVVFDYPNKRIGWKVPPPGALAQMQQQEQEQMLAAQQQQQQQHKQGQAQQQ